MIIKDDFLNDLMTIYIEREILKIIDSDSIIDEFYFMKNRKAQFQ